MHFVLSKFVQIGTIYNLTVIRDITNAKRWFHNLHAILIIPKYKSFFGQNTVFQCIHYKTSYVQLT